MRTSIARWIGTLLCLFAATPALAGPACDVVVAPGDDLQALVDDPAYAVYCLTPGQYGTLSITRSGTSGTRLELRFYDPANPADTSRAIERPLEKQAVFNQIDLFADYWTFYGIRMEGIPLETGSPDNIIEVRGSYNTIDGIYLTASGEPDIRMNGILLTWSSTHNTVQNSFLTVPNAKPYRDMACVRIGNSAYVTIVNNEMRDCAGDAIAINRGDPDDHRPGIVIEDNELYITPALYVDCTDPSLVPPGYQCSCAENALDVKHTVAETVVDPDPSDWLQVRKNIMYGFRPAEVTCGGSGTLSQAIGIPADQRADYAVIEDNIVFDTGIGLRLLGESKEFVLRNNLLLDAFRWGFDIERGDNVTLENNTIAGTPEMKHWVVLTTPGAATISDNIIIDGNVERANAEPGYTIGSNAFINTPVYSYNFNNSDDEYFDSTGDLSWDAVCFTVERFSNPHQKCLDVAVPAGGQLPGDGYRKVLPPVMQSISFLAGWNTVSLNVDPPDPDLEAVLADILPDVVMVQNDLGQIYYPAFGIDEIGSWDPYEAYEINVDADVTLTVTGNGRLREDAPIDLITGWNLVSFTLDREVDIQEALGSIYGQYSLVVDELGRLYYPELGINEIGTMKPGEGYEIYATTDCTLVYPSGI